MKNYKVKINYSRAEPEDQVYLLLTAASVDNLSGLTAGQPTSIKDFRASNPDMTITLGDTKGARFYVGITPFPTKGQPDPTNNQYYGWIEFTRQSSDPFVWLNLSNVDCTGLPITVTGTDCDGFPYSLGYKSPANLIQKSLSMQIGATGASAVISCPGPSGFGPYTKIVGPNKMPSSYPSYSSFIDSLASKDTSITILSDCPGGTYTAGQIFTGSFSEGETFLSLTGNFGDTWVLKRDQFDSNYAYQCAGGKVWWNGKEVDQNWVTPGTTPTPSQVFSDSTFRLLVVGVNEGYLVAGEHNYTTNYPYFFPFQNFAGSIYADTIHENSNSYGFPYSDSNLKVQVHAGKNSTINMNIIPDNVEADYSSSVPYNILLGGKYQFGIGDGSDLGNIKMGNCTYTPTSKNSYGGFLPTFDEWYKIGFNDDPDQYIWVKTPGSTGPSVEAGNAFVAPPMWINDVLTWGSNVTWTPGAIAPTKPTN